MLMKFKGFKTLSKQEMIEIKGGEGEDDFAPEDGGTKCVSCTSNGDCSYKPNLYCEASTSCLQYNKVCRRTVIC